MTHTTHYACQNQIVLYGGKAECCKCIQHPCDTQQEAKPKECFACDEAVTGVTHPSVERAAKPEKLADTEKCECKPHFEMPHETRCSMCHKTISKPEPTPDPLGKPKQWTEKECDEMKKAHPVDCDYGCGYTAPYGFVPEADCPEHDAPAKTNIEKVLYTEALNKAKKIDSEMFPFLKKFTLKQYKDFRTSLEISLNDFKISLVGEMIDGLPADKIHGKCFDVVKDFLKSYL